jgi:hypothetical protein
VTAPIATQPVTYRVTGVERVTGSGRLVGLANCDVEIGGIVVALQGIQIRRLSDGGLVVAAPLWRHPRSGKWMPGVILPDELSEALADEVIQCAREMGLE